MFLPLLFTFIGAIVIKYLFEVLSPRNITSKAIIEWEKRGEYINCFGFKVFAIQEGEFKIPEKTLMLLHGYPESSFVFKEQMELLKKHFSCIIAFDYIGFGLSDKPGEKRRD